MATANLKQDLPSKRIPRCAGCSTPLSEHEWGIPSQFCEGHEKSSPSNYAASGNQPKESEDRVEDIDSQISGLEDEFTEPALEEERQAKLQKVASLQRQIAEKRAKLQAAAENHDDFPLPPVTGPGNIAELKSALQGTPLDGILQPLDAPNNTSTAPFTSWNGQSQAVTAGQMQTNPWLETRTSEMFLKPGQLPKGEKVLRIIDFVDNIVPREDERTISHGGNTKLIVSYGPKRPKLEQLTLNQWVVSNTRIYFTTVLANWKLKSQQDIQHYLT